MEFSDADLEYIRTNYVTLDKLCAERVERPSEVRSQIDERLLPQPSYVLADGTEMFPRDYFRLPDEAGGVSTGWKRTSRSGCARRATTTSKGSGTATSAGSTRSAFMR
jgi:hypothetical protein